MNPEADVLAHDDEEDHIDDVYLTFKVDGESYGVGVAHVTEIVRIQEVNRMPGMSGAFRGVINLRGHVVPVLDMRVRFGLSPLESNDRTVIVVLELAEERAGLMVEEVTEVVEIAARNIEPASSAVGPERAKSTLVKGVAKRGEKICMVLDVERVLGDRSATAGGSAGEASVLQGV
jgi:purine-binding chemotaxis protein CheW